jgi:hypothetical protein
MLEEMRDFYYLDCIMGYGRDSCVNINVNIFQQFCGSMKLIPIGECQKQTLLKLYNVIAILMLLYGSEFFAHIPKLSHEYKPMGGRCQRRPTERWNEHY